MAKVREKTNWAEQAERAAVRSDIGEMEPSKRIEVAIAYQVQAERLQGRALLLCVFILAISVLEILPDELTVVGMKLSAKHRDVVVGVAGWSASYLLMQAWIAGRYSSVYYQRHRIADIMLARRDASHFGHGLAVVGAVVVTLVALGTYILAAIVALPEMTRLVAKVCTLVAGRLVGNF